MIYKSLIATQNQVMDGWDLVIMAVAVLLLIVGTVAFKKAGEAPRRKFYTGVTVFQLLLTLALIYMGAMTVSTRSGMAFPDWPTSDGVLWPSWNYFMSQDDRFYEHVHRLLGQVVGLFGIYIFALSFFYEKKRNFRHAGIVFFMICIQGALGAITVLNDTLWLTTVLHGVFAQICLAAMGFLVLRNTKSYQSLLNKESFAPKVRGLAKGTLIVVVIQLLLGAVFRNKAKVFTQNEHGKIIYKEMLEGNFGWLYSHVTFALPVAIMVFVLGVVLLKTKTVSKLPKFFGIALHSMMTAQLLLGLVAFFTVHNRDRGKFGFAETALTSGHVVNGAMILMLVFMIYRMVIKAGKVEITEEKEKIEC